MIDKQISVWIQNGDVVKGEIDFNTGTIIFYDKFDNVLMKRTGLTPKQLTEIQRQIHVQLSKREHIGFYYIPR